GLRGPGRGIGLGRGDACRARAAAGGGPGPAGRVPVRGRGLRRPKSMWTIGHSRGVADLAAQAAAVAGLPAADEVLLRPAALVHDIGRVTVPFSVWAKPGPLTRGEREQVRLHAYHSERVLDAADGLRPLARLAGSHGERCDGSGYHRGSRAADLPPAARLLAAADCYHAMREPRAYRPPLSPAAAAGE